ncbi:type 2 DNA topoisomerase 6 subunit B-like [Myripristis murdjan]|uniref:type 2 DNA topoisomerase 6 subunit B-like n=1 Tax=Myripristis murdjan TaxID=586833 RepID=UPI001175D553|nr:type 2 DNA topoisomerase 6 subunit B-like [Myripristis murdjan]
MLKEIQQVLRLLMLLRKQRVQQGLKSAGGLLVLLWTGPGPADQNCSVAGAGPWCSGIKTETLQPVLTELHQKLSPCAGPFPEPDPEELCAFADLHGSLRVLLSFQVRGQFSAERRAHLEAFLHRFSLANTEVKIYLSFKSDEEICQRVFSVTIKSRLLLKGQPPLTLDVTCKKQPPVCVGRGAWCQGGHPVFGARLPLSIPPEAMDHGLYGELSLQLVTLLSPCVLQYPNLATHLAHIQVLVYNPSNVPVLGPSAFLHQLPARLDCEELGLQGLRYSSCTDLVDSCGTVYTVEHGNYAEPQQERSPAPVQQGLSLFLFLQHSDPFTSQLSDVMATEELLEHHLEAILNNNRRAVTEALQAELKNTLKAQSQRSKDQEKLNSAFEVMLSSAMSIITSSSNMNFRTACLDSMKVRGTHELPASLHGSLRRVSSWKFTPRSRCFSAQVEKTPDSREPSSNEI